MVAIAVGTGAGVQIARTSAPPLPVAPIVAVAPEVRTSTSPPAAVAPPSTSTSAPAARSTTTRPTTSRVSRVPRTTSRAERTAAVDEDGPVIFGQSAAQAYRGCVLSTNSPGPAQCRRLVDAGVRGE